MNPRLWLIAILLIAESTLAQRTHAQSSIGVSQGIANGNASQASGTALIKANNLGDVGSAQAALTNLAGPFAANVNLTGTDTMSLSGGNQKFTLTANETLTIQSGTLPVTASATKWYPVQFEICQNVTGNFTLAFTAGSGVGAIQWSGGAQPGYTLTPSNGDLYSCIYNGTNLACREIVSNVPCI